MIYKKKETLKYHTRNLYTNKKTKPKRRGKAKIRKKTQQKMKKTLFLLLSRSFFLETDTQTHTDVQKFKRKNFLNVCDALKTSGNSFFCVCVLG